MKPVMQTQFSPDPASPDVGNCFAACVASILGADLEHVPNFVVADYDWMISANRWLAEHYGLVLVDRDVADHAMADWNGLVNGIWCILSGKSPRGDHSHAVVGRYHINDDGHWFSLVHDPHPDQTFLDGPPKWAAMFVVVDPTEITLWRRIALKHSREEIGFMVTDGKPLVTIDLGGQDNEY